MEMPLGVNFPLGEAWREFWNSLTVAVTLTQSEEQWCEFPQCSLLRLISPERRLSVRLDRIDARFSPGSFVGVSVDATMGLLGAFRGAVAKFFVHLRWRYPRRPTLPLAKNALLGKSN